MPELPEVHGYQQYINATILHKKIVHLECRDDRLLKMTLPTFKKHLLGEEFTGTERIGKYLFLKTTGDRILVMHFGMTGRPKYFHDVDDRPKFGHIMLAFDNDYHFAFENKRKFGWWDLTENIEEFRKEHKLSIDARQLTLEAFRKSIDVRSIFFYAAPHLHRDYIQHIFLWAISRKRLENYIERIVLRVILFQIFI